MSPNHFLLTPVEFLKGIGPQRADLLKKELGIFTYKDLLNYYPYRYIDRTHIYKIKEIDHNSQFIQVQGKLNDLKIVGGGRAKRLSGILKDDTGKIELVWFQGAKWIQKILRIGQEYIAFGRPNLFKGVISIPHPELEFVDDQKEASAPVPIAIGMYAMYNTTEKLKMKGISSKIFSKFINTLLKELKEKDIDETLPKEIIEKYRLLSRYKALVNIHQPANNDLLHLAERRLKFEELFFIQMELLRIKASRKINYKGFVFEYLGEFFNSFYDQHLPFELTNAQKKVLKEIRKDLLSGKQMNRLLQGDVGSGKTIVALLIMLMAIDNGFQACLMAPTEILSQQHFQTIGELLKNLNLKIALLTGSTKTKERKELLQELADGKINILLGTHALIEETVAFKNLALVIIDEQHRFGVAQRAKLWIKNNQPPHVLVMTATPIPRTLAMTLYADLDVSVIDELPPGRKEIITVHRFDSARLRVFGFMKEQLELGRQIYVVYPLIQESEKLDYKDLMDGYESITREFPLPKYKVGIVHGQMKNEDKEYEMQRFVKGDSNILVATTVIEVGVNVPNASVMVIESAERFGLSQLHQLRGRVGRGADQSFCILMTGNKLSKEARERIKIMVKTNNGFEIAEADLKLRGPGDMTGLQQSGVVGLQLADLIKDTAILQEARNTALDLLETDPSLEKPENLPIKKYFANKQAVKKVGWSKIS